MVISILHGPTPVGYPLFEPGDGPAEAALRIAEAQYRRTVLRVLLGVPHELECNRPGPRDGGKGESALVEDRLGHGVFLRRRCVEDGVKRAALLAICV